MELNFSLTPSTGMAGGMVYQFAEGRWRDGLGRGLVMSEVAYDFIEPILDRACPGTSDIARYGVAEFDPEMCKSLAQHFRQSAERARTSLTAEFSALAGTPEEIRGELARDPYRYEELSDFFSSLADWLEDAAKRHPVISLLGL